VTRSLLALTALLLSFTFTASEAPVSHVVKANSLHHAQLVAESFYTAQQQTEKHFLPADELQLSLIHADYLAVSLFTPPHSTVTTDRNIRGPPSIRA
tara:strand:- start:206 stop:496 length:291 start_codon:yes stop_codon:yes gene_type:complete